MEKEKKGVVSTKDNAKLGISHFDIYLITSQICQIALSKID